MKNQKNNMLLYRIFSYFLLVIAILFGLVGFIRLLGALAEPVMLFEVFQIFAVVVYSVASFKFLTNGIDGKQVQQSSLRDWIKVNAFVSIFFVIGLVTASVGALINPSLITDFVGTFPVIQPKGAPPIKGVMVTMLKAIFCFFILYAVILAWHIVLTFRFLKEQAHLFGDKKSAPSGNGF